jgi:hypothetical protein
MPKNSSQRDEERQFSKIIIKTRHISTLARYCYLYLKYCLSQLDKK